MSNEFFSVPNAGQIMDGLTIINIFGAVCIVVLLIFGDKMAEYDRKHLNGKENKRGK